MNAITLSLSDPPVVRSVVALTPPTATGVIAIGPPGSVSPAGIDFFSRDQSAYAAGQAKLRDLAYVHNPAAAGHQPHDTYNYNVGPGQQLQLQSRTTQVATIAISNPGTTTAANGRYYVNGQTGAGGNHWTGWVTVAGGVATAIELVSPGAYTFVAQAGNGNPNPLNADPVQGGLSPFSKSVGTNAAGQPVLNVTSTAGVQVNVSVVCPGVPNNAKVLSVNSATQVTLTVNITTAVAVDSIVRFGIFVGMTVSLAMEPLNYDVLNNPQVSAQPINPITQASTGGSGTGAMINALFSGDALLTKLRTNISFIDWGQDLCFNGAMRIDQQHEGDVIPVANDGFVVYLVDGFSANVKCQNSATWQAQRIAPGPFGLPHWLEFKCVSAATPHAFDQGGFIVHNIQQSDWGHVAEATANAKTIWISFWAMSSLSGVWSVGLQSYAFVTPHQQIRSCFGSYTLTAGTPKWVSIPIPGDTLGPVLGWRNEQDLVLSDGTISNGKDYIGVQVTWTFTAPEIAIDKCPRITPYSWRGLNTFVTTDGQVNLQETSGAYLRLAGVMVTVGERPPPQFYMPWKEADQRRSQYRYWKTYREGDKPGTVTQKGARWWPQVATATRLFNAYVDFPTMRVPPPTVSIYSPNSGLTNKLYSSTLVADFDVNFGFALGDSAVALQSAAPVIMNESGYIAGHVVMDART